MVFLNWAFIGETKNPKTLVNEIKKRRRSGKLSYEVNVYHDEVLDEILINDSGGRIRRPLVIVKDGKPMPDCLVEFEKLQAKIIPKKDIPPEEFITFEAKTDSSGVVTFGVYEHGWFAITAVYDTRTVVRHGSHEGNLILRSTLWVNSVPKPKAGE